MAAEVAAPLSQAKKITMVSSGQGDVGAAKLTGEVLTVMEKLPQVVEGMTGVDIAKVGASHWNSRRQLMDKQDFNKIQYFSIVPLRTRLNCSITV